MDGEQLADLIRTAKDKARRRQRPLYIVGTAAVSVSDERPATPCVAVYPGGRVEVLEKPAR